MARIRTIKPTFFTSLTIGGLPLSARLSFIGLWTYCDDSGRGRDDPRLIKAALWPLDDSHSLRRVEADLDALEKADLIERYLVDGQRYIRIRSWGEHQRINRPSPSAHPPSPEESLNGAGPRTEGSLPEGNKEGKGKERNSDSRNASTHDAADADRDESGDTKPKPTNPPWATDPLVQRWCQDVTGNHRAAHQADVWRVIDHLRRHVDETLIDEAIGTCAGLEGRPASPNYLLTTVTSWAAKRHGIRVPKLAKS